MNTYLWNTDEYLFLRMHMKCLRNTYGIPTNAYGTPMYLRVPTNPYGIPTNDYGTPVKPLCTYGYLRNPYEYL